MKELSIEEKAKRYDEAIDVCRKLYNKAKADGYTSDIEDYEDIFPELKESEDERIRKEMIETLKNEAHEFPSSIIAEKSKSWITWLEKQGEQGEQKFSEWSEEDIDNIKNIIILCNHSIEGIECTWIPSQAAKIKKLMESILHSSKPQSHWKPNDEQIEALETTLYTNISRNDERYSILSEFVAELKKLKE